MTSDALRHLITTLRGKFDLVIIDSAPLVPVHDSLLLSQFSDAALFVTHAGKTSRDALSVALRSLKATKTPVLGVALTRMKADPRYAYHDYLYGARPRIAAATTVPTGIVGKLRGLISQTVGAQR
jgi:succinoglycan biosynthesis transport protein ExoP